MSSRRRRGLVEDDDESRSDDDAAADEVSVSGGEDDEEDDEASSDGEADDPSADDRNISGNLSSANKSDKNDESQETVMDGENEESAGEDAAAPHISSRELRAREKAAKRKERQDPAYVPRSGGYFLHDDREEDPGPSRGGRSSASSGRSTNPGMSSSYNKRETAVVSDRGRGTGRAEIPSMGHGSASKKEEDVWRHDKFEELIMYEDAPSSADSARHTSKPPRRGARRKKVESRSNISQNSRKSNAVGSDAHDDGHRDVSNKARGGGGGDVDCLPGKGTFAKYLEKDKTPQPQQQQHVRNTSDGACAVEGSTLRVSGPVSAGRARGNAPQPGGGRGSMDSRGQRETTAGRWRDDRTAREMAASSGGNSSSKTSRSRRECKEERPQQGRVGLSVQPPPSEALKATLGISPSGTASTPSQQFSDRSYRERATAAAEGQRGPPSSMHEPYRTTVHSGSKLNPSAPSVIPSTAYAVNSSTGIGTGTGIGSPVISRATRSVGGGSLVTTPPALPTGSALSANGAGSAASTLISASPALHTGYGSAANKGYQNFRSAGASPTAAMEMRQQQQQMQMHMPQSMDYVTAMSMQHHQQHQQGGEVMSPVDMEMMYGGAPGLGAGGMGSGGGVVPMMPVPVEVAPGYTVYDYDHPSMVYMDTGGHTHGHHSHLHSEGLSVSGPVPVSMPMGSMDHSMGHGIGQGIPMGVGVGMDLGDGAVWYTDPAGLPSMQQQQTQRVQEQSVGGTVYYPPPPGVSTSVSPTFAGRSRQQQQEQQQMPQPRSPRPALRITKPNREGSPSVTGSISLTKTSTPLLISTPAEGSAIESHSSSNSNGLGDVSTAAGEGKTTGSGVETGSDTGSKTSSPLPAVRVVDE